MILVDNIVMFLLLTLNRFSLFQQASAYSKSTIETLEKGVKYVQS